MTKPRRKLTPHTAGTRRRDIDALVKAAVWLTYLNPKRAQARKKHDVAGLLAASPVPAVRAVVGKAGGKRLSNLLTGDRRREMLVPSWRVLGAAILWAEKAGLPVVPMEKMSEIAPEVGVVPRTFSRLLQFERDVWTVAFAVSEQEDTLPPKAREALRRIVLRLLKRVVQLADDG